MPLSSEKETKAHVDYFDYLRLIATISVVFMHSASARLQTFGGGQWELLNLCVCLAFTAVPLFLMMSGYLLLSDEKTTDVTVLLRRRLPKLLVPLAAWTVIAIVQRLTLQNSLDWPSFRLGLLQSFYEPAAIHFWYMYLLIGLYVLSPFLYGAVQCLDGKGRRFVLVLIALVTVQEIGLAVLPPEMRIYVSFDLIFRLKLYEGHLCTFLLGWLLGSTKREIPNRILIPAAVVLLAVLAGGTYLLSVQNGMYTSSLQKQGAGLEVMLAACLFLLFKQNAKKPAAFFRAVPVIPLNLPIYFVHNLLLAALQNEGYYPQSFLEVTAMTAFLFAVSYALSKTLASVKPLCFLLTGMSYKAACQSCNWVYTYRKLRARLGPQGE